jgi:protein translocase SecG subunit
LNPLFLLAAAASNAVPKAAAPLLPKGAVPGGVPAGAPGAPGAPPVPTGPAPQTAVAAHLGWLTHGIAGIFVLSAILLILLLAIQTTKQEGLTGTIGGRVESAYRGRLGAEEQLKRWTGIVAVCFVVSAFVLSLTGI